MDCGTACADELDWLLREHAKRRDKGKFKKEVERWIDEGILIPWSGKVEGILPLMAVVQPTKKKVRPVLDFRESNKYVACHTRDKIDVCEEV